MEKVRWQEQTLQLSGISHRLSQVSRKRNFFPIIFLLGNLHEARSTGILIRLAKRNETNYFTPEQFAT